MDFIQAPAAKKVPAFSVEKLEGKVKKTVHGFKTTKLENGKFRNELTVKTVEEDAGYLVKFSKGHSIRVSNEAALRKLSLENGYVSLDKVGNVVSHAETVEQ